MRKQELIEQLTSAKTLTSTVDIDKVIGMIKQLETPTTITGELGREIVDRIERCLDCNNENLVDLDSAEFEIDYNHTIRVTDIDVNVCEIMEHVTAIMDEYIVLEEDDEDDEEGRLVDIDEA